MSDALLLAALAILAGFFLARAMRYLHILQQDDYDNGRFLRWLASGLEFDKKLSAGLLVAWAAGAALGHAAEARAAGALLLAAALAVDVLAMRRAKKKLVLTKRAQRILAATAPTFLAVAWAAFAWEFALPAVVVAVQAAPFAVALGNLLMRPVERRIAEGFRREGREKFLRLAPVTIGVTGSYGKTSVKHVLGHVLNAFEPTLITPGSVNTEMGVTRIIRERLDPSHRYFVVEMGAYGIGSIARLCRLTEPDCAIVTSIGVAHHERFKGLENVARAKLELAEAAFAKADGGGALPNAKVVVGESLFASAYFREFHAAHRDRMLTCGRNDCDYRVTATRQTTEGVEVDFDCPDGAVTLKAPIYGTVHAQNLVMAYALARQLGHKPAAIAHALTSLPQIRHRMEVSRLADGTTLVDDAYNSNPSGFVSAVELLSLFKQEGGRRILVTPGVVELGDVHEETHARLGEACRQHVDVLLVVRPERIESFVTAFSSGNAAQVMRFAAMKDAQAWLAENKRPGDVVLYENDLPDLYEARLGL